MGDPFTNWFQRLTGLYSAPTWIDASGGFHYNIPPSERLEANIPDDLIDTENIRLYSHDLGGYSGGDLTGQVGMAVPKGIAMTAMMVPLGEGEAATEGGGGLFNRLKNLFKGKPNCPLQVAPWVKDAGSFAKFAENLERDAVMGKTLSPKQLDELVELARKYGVDIRADPPHGGTIWNMPHLNIGKVRAHIPFPPNWTPPKWIPRGDLPLPSE